MMSFNFKTLIFDRTEKDIQRAISIINKVKIYGMIGLTDNERLEWYSGLRACRNASDINRIEACCKHISDMLGLGFETKTNWNNSEIIKKSDINRILSNIDKIRYCYHIIKDGTPTTPEQPINNIEKMNDIEKILFDKCSIINNNLNDTVYCGDGSYNGELINKLM